MFILLPIIDELTFFTPENLQENKALGRIANALFNPWTIIGIKWTPFAPNYSLIANFINKLLRIIFQIAAFALITPTGKGGGGETYSSVIQTVVGLGPNTIDGNPMDKVVKFLKTTAQIVTVMA